MRQTQAAFRTARKSRRERECFGPKNTSETAVPSFRIGSTQLCRSKSEREERTAARLKKQSGRSSIKSSLPKGVAPAEEEPPHPEATFKPHQGQRRPSRTTHLTTCRTAFFCARGSFSCFAASSSISSHSVRLYAPRFSAPLGFSGTTAKAVVSVGDIGGASVLLGAAAGACCGGGAHHPSVSPGQARSRQPAEKRTCNAAITDPSCTVSSVREEDKNGDADAAAAPSAVS